MDFTFWVGLGVLLVIWPAARWAFSRRRESEKARGRNPEAADAMLDVERAKDKGKFDSTWGP